MKTINVELNVDSKEAVKSVNSLEQELEQLRAEFSKVEIGSKEFNKLGNAIKKTEGQIKDIELQFESLDKEQRITAIADSFAGLAGTVEIAVGAFAALGIESEGLENVERRVVGLIGVVQGLQAAGQGVIAFNKVIGTSFKTAFTTATGAINTTRVALAGLGIGVLIFALTKLIENWDNVTGATDRATEAQDEYNASIRELIIEQARLKQGEIVANTLKLADAQDELNKILERQKPFREELVRIEELQRKQQRLTFDARIKEINQELSKDEEKRLQLENTIEALNQANKKARKQESDAFKKSQEEIAKRVAARKKETTERRLDELETGKALEKSISLEDKFTKKIQEGTVLRVKSYGEDADAREERLKRLQKAQQDAFAEDAEEAKARIDELAQFGGSVISNIRSFQEQNAELQQIALKNLFEQGLITEEEYLKRSDELNKKAFEQNKNVSIAQAIISTIQGGVDAFTSTLKIDPTGITGSILAGLALAAGYAQVDAIRSTTYESPNQGPSSIGGGGSARVGVPLSTGGGTPGGLFSDRITLGQDSATTGAGGTTKMYVLAGDVTSAQAANAKIKQRRTL
jgi:uncharacterized protein YqgQ